MRKILRELRREFPGAEIRTNGRNHYEIILNNGRMVVVSNSPSDRRFMANVAADARRQATRTGDALETTKEKST